MTPFLAADGDVPQSKGIPGENPCPYFPPQRRPVHRGPDPALDFRWSIIFLICESSKSHPYKRWKILARRSSDPEIDSPLLSMPARMSALAVANMRQAISMRRPGGSALSSELIWREINQLRQDKPVVVSFSDLAASGGYYMAVGADKIITEPTTLTGSIGVFATIPNLSGLAGKVGINSEQVGTHRQSVDYSLFEPMSDEFREVLREGIETTYRTFLERVAEGRGITVAQADSLAQGRVWSGADAVKLGLADALGGMPEALEAAAGLAGISDYRIVPLPKYKTGLERLLDDLGGTDSEARESLLEEELGPDWAEVLRALKAQLRQEGVQARLPFTIKIH